MAGTQSGVSGEAMAARLAAWGALHRSLPPQTFFALYFPALKQGKCVYDTAGGLRRKLEQAAAATSGGRRRHICSRSPSLLYSLILQRGWPS